MSAPATWAEMLVKYGSDQGIYEAWKAFALNHGELDLVNQNAYAARLFAEAVDKFREGIRELERVEPHRPNVEVFTESEKEELMQELRDIAVEIHAGGAFERVCRAAQRGHAIHEYDVRFLKQHLRRVAMAASKAYAYMASVK